LKSGGEALIKALVKSALFVKEKKLKAFVDNDSIMAQHKLALWELVEGSTVAKAMHLDELVRAFNLQAYEAAHEYRDAVASQRSPEPIWAYGMTSTLLQCSPRRTRRSRRLLKATPNASCASSGSPLGLRAAGVCAAGPGDVNWTVSTTHACVVDFVCARRGFGGGGAAGACCGHQPGQRQATQS